MTWLAIIGWATVGSAAFGAYVWFGAAIGRAILSRFGRIAVVDRRDEERFL